MNLLGPQISIPTWPSIFCWYGDSWYKISLNESFVYNINSFKNRIAEFIVPRITWLECWDYERGKKVRSWKCMSEAQDGDKRPLQRTLPWGHSLQYSPSIAQTPSPYAQNDFICWHAGSRQADFYDSSLTNQKSEIYNSWSHNLETQQWFFFWVTE
jgi:hypothetical protein